MNKESFLRAFICGFISFICGALINLIFMLLAGEVHTVNIISILVCALIGLIGGVSIYRIHTRQE